MRPGMRTGRGTDRRHAGLFWTLAERGRAAMEHNPDLDALAAMHRGRADLMEQIRLSQEMLEQSQELLRQIDEQLAKYPLKP